MPYLGVKGQGIGVAAGSGRKGKASQSRCEGPAAVAGTDSLVSAAMVGARGGSGRACSSPFSLESLLQASPSPHIHSGFGLVLSCGLVSLTRPSVRLFALG